MLVVSLIIIFGLGWYIYSIWLFVLALRSKSWPTTRGQIGLSKLERRGFSKLQAFVHFSYRVNDKTYTAKTISLGPIPRHPLALVQDYPRSKVVTVYYDPKNPSRAVLEAGPSMRNLYALLFGLAIVLLGVLCGA